MAKVSKEIPEDVKELIPLITSKTDPLQDELDKLEKEKNKKVTDQEKKERKIEDAKTPKPEEPKAQLGDWASVAFGGWGAISAILLVLHCIVWVLKLMFDISWNTWGWFTFVFCWGLGIAIVVSAVRAYLDFKDKQEYKEKLAVYEAYVALRKKLTPMIKKLKKEIKELDGQILETVAKRYEALYYAIIIGVGVPFPQKGISSDVIYSQLKKSYLKLLQMRKDIETTTDIDEKWQKKKAFMNAKLDFVYKYSLKAEVSDDVYEEFGRQYKKKDASLMVLRQELPQVASRGVKEISMLPEYRALLDNNAMQPILDQMEQVKSRDTTGMFGLFQSNDKKTEQTKAMKKLVKAANKEYKELQDLHGKVMYALYFVRGCAYRNIYLGAELLNYLRDKAAGGTLTIVNDIVGLDKVNMSAVNINVGQLETDAVGAALNAAQGFSNIVGSSSLLSDFATKNPKYAIGAQALVAIGGGILDHFDKIAANEEAQEKMVSALSKITDGYLEGQQSMIRAIEIINSIIKCNEGFMAIYAPLRKKYLEEDQNCVTDKDKADIARLGEATNAYKKTAEAKL